MWVEEFTDIMLQEYGVKPLVRMEKNCNVEYDPTIIVGDVRVEGLPSDPGHLYEAMKRALDKLSGRGID